MQIQFALQLYSFRINFSLLLNFSDSGARVCMCVCMCVCITNVYTICPHFCRCFSFGIGSGASTHLVRGIAEAGGGTAEFVTRGERMQPKVCASRVMAIIMGALWWHRIHWSKCIYCCSTGYLNCSILLRMSLYEGKTERVFPFLDSLCAPAPLNLKSPLFVMNIIGTIYIILCI